VYEAMGVPASEFPVFAHLPFVLGLEGEKLGKRYGAASVSWYREEGFLPEAICNYLALLGWSPGDNREDLTLTDLAAEFDLARSTETLPSSTCASWRPSTVTRSGSLTQLNSSAVSCRSCRGQTWWRSR